MLNFPVIATFAHFSLAKYRELKALRREERSNSEADKFITLRILRSKKYSSKRSCMHFLFYSAHCLDYSDAVRFVSMYPLAF